jgi:DNA-binding transcriptional ArsR family regulator
MPTNQTPNELGEEALTALGNDVRRQIVGIIAQNPSSTNHIADQFPISRPAISRHLKVLADSGLIERQAQGTQSIYRLQGQGFGDCHAWLRQFWPDTLKTFKVVAESTYMAETNE